MKLLCLAIASLIAAVAHSAPCSDSCANEFLRGCIPFHCNEGADMEAAWNDCRGEIDSGQTVLANAGCVKQCTSTPEMLDKKNDECGSPGGGNPPSSTCDIVPKVKPTTPQLCNADNKGCCECGTGDVTTYIFWSNSGTMQRCMHTVNVPSNASSGGKLPVVLHSQGYARGSVSEMGGWNTPAKYYGYAVIALSSLKGGEGPGNFALQFGNNNIANDTYPTPCSESDSREISYLNDILDWVDSNQALDSTKVYTTGFSQEAMFSAYAAICLAGRIAGVYQGGSGLSKTGYLPVTPGFEAQCTLTSRVAYEGECCAKDFCSECKYWPAYPRTCGNKLKMCVAIYTGDFACGADYYMYEAATAEGNDARMLSFAGGTHKEPENQHAWLAGCLGLSDSCSKTCASSFASCVGSTPDPQKFQECEDKIRQGQLAGCVSGCSPTLDMLMLSEAPVVTLSEGNFGRETGLAKATGPTPRPACSTPWGKFDETSGENSCKPPSGTVLPGPPNVSPCDSTGSTQSPTKSGDATTAPTASPSVRTQSPTKSGDATTASPTERNAASRAIGTLCIYVFTVCAIALEAMRA